MSKLPERLCEFASPGPLRDRLVGAVIQGRKTATSSLLAEWEQDQEPLPAAGQCQTVIDSDGRAVGIIELVAVEVIRLGDADERLAFEEGEGFADIGEWRHAHEGFWAEEVLPNLPAGLTGPLTDETLVVVERFRLVAEVSGAGDAR